MRLPPSDAIWSLTIYLAPSAHHMGCNCEQYDDLLAVAL